MTPGPQFHQLAMFHTAEELKNGPGLGHMDAPLFNDKDEMWRDKLRHVRMGGIQGWGHVPDAAAGIHEPVEIEHTDNGPTLSDGHHRVAAAHFHNPRALVPVEHWDAAQEDHVRAANAATAGW